MPKRKMELRKLILLAGIVVLLRFAIDKLGWRRPSLEPRMFLSLALWMIFGLYWAIAGLNSAPTQTAESRTSTYFHQFVLMLALFLAIWPVPWMIGWFLPNRSPLWALVGGTVQAGFLLFAVWARRHLGRNWSAEVRIAVDHQLIRTGPYRFLRHPIYTAMLGMVLGTAITCGQYHALLGLAILLIAYVRKSQLEEKILAQTFGAEYETYRRDTWALVPLVF